MVRHRLSSSATGVASHTPSAPKPSFGSRVMAATRNTKVLVQAISAEVLPLLSAEKREAANVLIPLNR